MTKMKMLENMSSLTLISIFILIMILNPLLFFDKLSFSMMILTVIFYLISFTCMKMVDKFYKNIKMMKMTFLLTMLILSLSFYFYSMFLFYIFFEISVIPIFMFIMTYGSSKNKMMASYYLFFFTLFSSLLFLISLFHLYSLTGSFNFFILSTNKNIPMEGSMLKMSMLIFLIKMPVFFFHIWLPLAHVESPMLGSMILASIMLKLGGYGLFRMTMIFFTNMMKMKMYMFIWGIWGSILAAIMSVSQIDLKKMIAYSSVSHMSIIMTSVYSMSSFGKSGSILMMLNHGMVSSLMFFGLGILYYRLNSRSMLSINSSSLISPNFSMWWFMIIAMNLGFPPFISFFSEFFIFLSMVIMKKEIMIMGMMLIMATSIYSINLLMYMISGLSKKKHLFSEMSLIENMIMMIKMFYLISSSLYLWMF